MDTRQEAAVNPEEDLRKADPVEEIKKIREKTDKAELTELKRGLLGGYSSSEVDQYIDRLKSQLHSSERIFKGHIAELASEKDQLRGERDVLLARLESGAETDVYLQKARQVADGLMAEKIDLENQLAELSQLADSNIADLEAQVNTLNAELTEAREQCAVLTSEKDTWTAQVSAVTSSANARAEAFEQQVNGLNDKLSQSQQRCEGLQEERDALQNQLVSLAQEHETAGAVWLVRIQECEKQLAASQERLVEFEGKLGSTQTQLDRKSEELLQIRSQFSDAQQDNCRLNAHVDSLIRENGGLTSQIDVARQNIMKLIADKEAMEAVNAQLRQALNTLLVKANAVIKENEVLSGQLDSERDQVQLLQAMHEKLADILTRVSMANQLLNERLMDMDKVLAWSSGQTAGKTGSLPKRRSTKAELLDFTDGRSAAVREIVEEINDIQSSLSLQRQQLAIRLDAQDEAEGLET